MNCDRCSVNDAIKEIHFETLTGTKKYSNLCDKCFPIVKQHVINSENLVYKGFYSLVGKETSVYLPMQ